MHPVEVGSWWQHVRTGWLYQVVGLGRIERTGEEAVIYRGADGTVWVRPLSEWQEEVKEGQARGYAPRFSPTCAPTRPERPEMLANAGENALQNTANLCVVAREWLEETVDRLRELHRIKRGGRELATDWRLGADSLTVQGS